MIFTTDKTVCGPWELSESGAFRRSIVYPGFFAGSIGGRDHVFQWVVFNPRDGKAGSQGQAATLEEAKDAVDHALPRDGWQATDLPDTRPRHLRPLSPDTATLAHDMREADKQPLGEQVMQEIRAAVAAKVEACAAIVEGMSIGRDEDFGEVRARVSADIRALGGK